MRSDFEAAIPESIRRIANSADRHLAWEFFVFFSRFEYALKRTSRYLKPGEGPAEANWDRFASDYAESFEGLQSKELQKAIDYYLSYSPRKQLRNNGEMHWSEPRTLNGNEPLLVWLLTVVRLGRNNLFHGGKFPMIPISDPSRDRDLIGHAINILSACLILDEEVSRYFMDGIDE